MTATEIKSKYTGRKTISTRAACGHTLYAGTDQGVQDRTSEFRADAKTVVCTPCELLDATPIVTTMNIIRQASATPKQIKFARQLVRQHQGEYTAKGQIVSSKLLEDISKDDCSTLINNILSL